MQTRSREPASSSPTDHVALDMARWSAGQTSVWNHVREFSRKAYVMPEQHPNVPGQSLIRLTDTPEDCEQSATAALLPEVRQFPRYEMFAPKLLCEWRQEPPAAIVNGGRK